MNSYKLSFINILLKDKLLSTIISIKINISLFAIGCPFNVISSKDSLSYSIFFIILTFFSSANIFIIIKKYEKESNISNSSIILFFNNHKNIFFTNAFLISSGIFSSLFGNLIPSMHRSIYQNNL